MCPEDTVDSHKQSKIKITYFGEQRAMVLKGLVRYGSLSNLKKTLWYYSTKRAYVIVVTFVWADEWTERGYT